MDSADNPNSLHGPYTMLRVAAQQGMVTAIIGENAMDGNRTVVHGPPAHQPSKAELEEDVGIDATPEALAWAVTRGGANRWEREPSER